MKRNERTWARALPDEKGIETVVSSPFGLLAAGTGRAPSPMRRGLKPNHILGRRYVPHRARALPDEKGIETGFHSTHRSEEHTSELQSLRHLVCRLLLEKN